MRVHEQFRQCVAFLLQDRRDPVSGQIVRRPIGTAFLVGATTEEFGLLDPAFPLYPYVVTARHIIQSAGSRAGIYLRLNLRNGGGYDDLPIPPEAWVMHDKTDVAVADLPLDHEQYELTVVPLDYIATDDYIAQNAVTEGDSVFFAGLFSERPGRERSHPIVRFGDIALMPREPVSITVDPVTASVPVDAYLVEARSWGGQSGSPAFIYFPPGHSFAPGMGSPRLLGLVHGHYPITERVNLSGDYGTGEVKLNSGIAIVIPSQCILEVLNHEDLVEARRGSLIEAITNEAFPKAGLLADDQARERFLAELQESQRSDG